MALTKDALYRQEYHEILKACSDFGFSDTDDVPLSAIVRSAFQTLLAEAHARPHPANLEKLLTENTPTWTGEQIAKGMIQPMQMAFVPWKWVEATIDKAHREAADQQACSDEGHPWLCNCYPEGKRRVSEEFRETPPEAAVMRPQAPDATKYIIQAAKLSGCAWKCYSEKDNTNFSVYCSSCQNIAFALLDVELAVAQASPQGQDPT